jgi:hypothetical protein
MPFKVNALWEQREGRAICRYIVAWQEVDESTLAGALGGYSGGGGFQMEQFFAKHDGRCITTLMIDNEDKITGEEVEFFSDVPESVRSICDDAQDVIIGWHEQDKWEDAEQLILREDKRDLLTPEDDMLLFSTDNSPFLKVILGNAGITAAPGDNEEE